MRTLPTPHAPASSCCTLGNATWDVWVAWTVNGAVAFALGLLLTGRLLSAHRQPERPAAAEAGQQAPVLQALEPASPPRTPTPPPGQVQMAQSPPAAYSQV